MNALPREFQTALRPFAGRPDFTHGIQAIFFDCEGVIMESQPVAQDRCQTFFRSEAPVLLEQIRREHAPIPDERTIFNPLLDCRLTTRELDRLNAELEALLMLQGQNPALVRGALEFLETHFGRYDFFLLSDTEQACLDATCAQHRLSHYFRQIAGGRGKQIRWIKRLTSAFHIDPQNAVYLGASAEGHRIARKTGVHFIRVGTEPDTVPVISDLRDLDQALAKLPVRSRC